MTAGRSPAPALSPEEQRVVARFEAAEVLEEAFEPPFDDIYTDGAPVEVYEVNGGYVVIPRNRGMGLT